MSPGLKVIADEHGIKPSSLGENRGAEQFVGSELLRRCLVAQSQQHDPLRSVGHDRPRPLGGGRAAIYARRPVCGVQWQPPAPRVIDSFISGPPRSLAPASKHRAAPSAPIFTQEALIFLIRGFNTSLDTACMSTASRKLGPERVRPLRQSGASICT